MWLAIPEGRIPDYVYSGNTLAEAAKKAGMDGAELEKTIKKYNEDVAKGTDSKFGRQYLEGKVGKLVKIEKAPFFVFPISSVIFGIYCGLLINGRKIGEKRGVKFEFDGVIKSQPLAIHKELSEHLAKSATEAGLKVKKLPSGAGHDTVIFGNLLTLRPASVADLAKCSLSSL